MLAHSPYKGPGVMCHVVVADTVNAQYGWRFWMTTEALAKAARCSRAAAKRWLNTATTDGFLTLIEQGVGRGKPSVYRFEMPGSAKRVTATPFEEEKGSAKREKGSAGTSLSYIGTQEPNTDVSVSNSHEAEFESWWKLYPRKTDKARARKTFVARRRAGVPFADLERACLHYATSVANAEPQFVKHAATFLAGDDGPWSEWITRGPSRRRHDVPSRPPHAARELRAGRSRAPRPGRAGPGRRQRTPRESRNDRS